MNYSREENTGYLLDLNLASKNLLHTNHFYLNNHYSVFILLLHNFGCYYCYQQFSIVAFEERKKKYKENTLAYPIFIDKDIWLVKKKEEKKNLFDIYYTNTVDACTYTLIIVELFCLSLFLIQRKEKKTRIFLK